MKSKLEVGDKVMFISHARIVGITDVEKVEGETAFLTKSNTVVGKEIKAEINKQGFIAFEGIYNLFYYCQEVCEKLGFKYTPFD